MCKLGKVGCTCEKDGFIRHFASFNANGDAICYTTLSKEKLNEWKAEQSIEQKRLNDWLKKLQSGVNPVD
jgi:hypothetical protein